MDTEFWLILAVMIIAFGYFKAWPALRKMYTLGKKLKRSFQGIQLNPHSTLTEEQYKKVAVGALYAYQQGACLNTLNTDIKEQLPQILGEWWGIHDAAEAHETLEYLHEKGFAYYFPFVYQAFLLDDEQKQDDIFQQNMTSQEDYEKAVSQLGNLKESYRELIDCKVITSQEDIARYGVIGWDAGRLNFIARACYDMEYITEEEAWKYIDKAYELAHSAFSSWHDMAMSYVIGRSLWGGTHAYNSSMKDFADELLEDAKSPWIQIKW